MIHCIHYSLHSLLPKKIVFTLKGPHVFNVDLKWIQKTKEKDWEKRAIGWRRNISRKGRRERETKIESEAEEPGHGSSVGRVTDCQLKCPLFKSRCHLNIFWMIQTYNNHTDHILGLL